MPANIDFDLDRSTSQAWAVFTRRLEEVISVMDSTADLKIGCRDDGADDTGYVLFHCEDSGTIRMEAASNAVLQEGLQLSAQQLTKMAEMGWQAPDMIQGSSNLWLTAPADDCAGLAEICTATLRDIYGVAHPIFLDPDQLAEVLQPPTEPLSRLPESNSEFDRAIPPSSYDHLCGLLDQTLIKRFGHLPIRDDEGDIAIRVGSTIVFVRATPDAREVIVFALIVHELSGRSRAAERLNDLNVEARYVRFSMIRDRVLVSLSVFAKPFVPSHFLQALDIVSELADGIDHELARELRGRTVFNESE